MRIDHAILLFNFSSAFHIGLPEAQEDLKFGSGSAEASVAGVNNTARKNDTSLIFITVDSIVI